MGLAFEFVFVTAENIRAIFKIAKKKCKKMNGLHLLSELTLSVDESTRRFTLESSVWMALKLFHAVQIVHAEQIEDTMSNNVLKLCARCLFKISWVLLYLALHRLDD